MVLNLQKLMQSKFYQKYKIDVKFSFVFGFLLVNMLFSFNSTLILSDINQNNMEYQIHSLDRISSSDFFQEELFYGITNYLEINESASLSDLQSYQIGNSTVSGYDPTNLEYYIDDTHNWIADNIVASISNIADERDWVKNGGLTTIDDWVYFEVDSSNVNSDDTTKTTLSGITGASVAFISRPSSIITLILIILIAGIIYFFYYKKK